MKILHIIDSGGLYGAETVLLSLVSEQVRMGLEPAIASIGNRGIQENLFENEAAKRGLRVKKFRFARGPNLIGAWKILRFAQREGFDLLHSHGYKGNILFGFMPYRFRKMPLVATLHGWTSTNRFSKLRLYEWLDLRSLRFIDAVVLVSKAMQSHKKPCSMSGVNFLVVNNGIPLTDRNQQTDLANSADQPSDSSNQPTLDRTIVDFCKHGFTIGSIGRLSKEKGFNYLIEALGLLNKEGFDVRLVIIGEGDERTLLEKLTDKLGLSERVLLPGYLKEAKQYIAYFDVFVISSLTEGLPITLLEAMQMGVPIVATEVGGIPDVLESGNCGLLCRCEVAGELASAIKRLYDDPELSHQLTIKAKENVLKNYSARSMAAGYVKIYSRLLKKT